jgi:hypothetical protein
VPTREPPAAVDPREAVPVAAGGDALQRKVRQDADEGGLGEQVADAGEVAGVDQEGVRAIRFWIAT